MSGLTDRSHPFYKPLWRRIVIVAVVAAWAASELVLSRDPFWMVIAFGILVYAVWTFLLTWPKDDAAPPAG